MSSSDSEAFESADEDFNEIDDKKKVKNKLEENEIKNKEKIPEKKERSISPPDMEQCWEGPEQEAAEKRMTEKKKEQADSVKKVEVVKPVRPEIGIPPQRTGCWAGPVKEEAEKRWAELKSKKSDKEKPIRPEYGIPPARTVCWEEPDQKAAEKKWSELEKKEEVEKTEYGIPPARTVCWDGPIRQEAEAKWAKEKLNSKIPEKPVEKIVRSPSPPDMEQCWEGPEQEAAEKRWAEKKKQDDEEALLVAAKNLKIENENDGWEFDSWEEVEPDVKTEFPVVSNLSPSTEAKLSQPKTSPKFPVKANESLEEEISDTNISNVFDKISKDQSEKQTTWGWKPWGGVVNFLSTASEGVANLIGVPDPEEMAKMHHEELKKKKEENSEKTEEEITTAPKREEGLRLGNIVSGVTQISSRVINGGLDTLEGIGKKTMTMLQENDPGLMNKRKMLGMDVDKPVLSQILREAKEKTEESERNLKQMQKHMYKKQIHFETLFDDYHGLVHLEALEMLSKQSTLRLQSLLTPLTGKALNELQETINEVQELCELPEQDNDDSDGFQSVEDLKQRFQTAVEDLDVEVDFKELINCWEENTNWLSNLDEIPTPQDVHTKAIHCLAQTTALAVNKMHKLAEVLLVLDHHSTANEADSMVQLTTVFCWHLSGIAVRFSDKLSDIGASADTNSLITSIFMEGSNSTSYIQKTFQLFIPILQMGAA